MTVDKLPPALSRIKDILTGNGFQISVPAGLGPGLIIHRYQQSDITLAYSEYTQRIYCDEDRQNDIPGISFSANGSVITLVRPWMLSCGCSNIYTNVTHLTLISGATRTLLMLSHTMSEDVVRELLSMSQLDIDVSVNGTLKIMTANVHRSHPTPEVVDHICSTLKPYMNRITHLHVVATGELLQWREIFLKYSLQPVTWRAFLSDPNITKSEFIEKCIEDGLEDLL